MDAEVLILLMDYSYLSFVQREGLSVYQVLDHLELDQQVVVLQEPVDVDLVQVLLQQAVVNVGKTSLRWS